VFHLSTEARKTMRVQMLLTKKVETSSGSFVQYQAGELYLLPETKAKKWIEKGYAIDPTKERGRM
jgi:hypothetical protein